MDGGGEKLPACARQLGGSWEAVGGSREAEQREGGRRKMRGRWEDGESQMGWNGRRRMDMT